MTETELIEKIDHILYLFRTLRLSYKEARNQILALVDIYYKKREVILEKPEPVTGADPRD